LQSVPAGNLLDYLKQVPDPRGRQGRRHTLQAMLATVTCAVLCGARGYAAIAEWVHELPAEIWHLLGYQRKPPTRNAYRDLLIALSPETLEPVIRRWIADVLDYVPSKDELQPVAMDGKTLCSTLAEHGGMVHLLSLFDQRSGCVLSQLKVDRKTNEHKAALQIIKTLLLKGRVVTGDAMFCQRDLCQEIIDRQGHYFFVVKDNQPSLRESLAAEFEAAFSPLH
jgi:hypothetical protein